jgi:hypothetical protein
MFKKLSFVFPTQINQKCLYLKTYIDRGNVLYRDDTIDFKFKQYDDGTDEKKLIDQYHGKYTVYKQVDFPYKAILNHFPKKLLQNEIPIVHWQTFEGGSLVPPHVDKGRLCAINYYIQTNNEKTITYRKKRDGARLETINGIITNESFIPEWIEEEDTFIAKCEDLYLLDVSKPHSVINMTEHARISISFSYYKTIYEQLVDLID